MLLVLTCFRPSPVLVRILKSSLAPQRGHWQKHFWEEIYIGVAWSLFITWRGRSRARCWIAGYIHVKG
jgi:hypothetical protein